MSDEVEPVLLDTKLTRPYTSTGGRTRATVNLGLLTLVCSTQRYQPRKLPPSMAAEHGEALLLCLEPASVSEVQAHMRLPVGVVRVLLSDLIDIDAAQAKDPEPYDPLDEAATTEVLQALLVGLQRRL